ncbi:MAG: CHAP domain-containing protein [Staphylococcus epidermidis]|nr:CHAP domain-containing protein [Staphylococcus epidermidis]
MKKIKTISTLVAGLGIAFLGHTTHADAAENNNQQQSTYNYSTTEVSFSNSGNLYTSGQAAGFTVNNTPEEGAIMQSSEGAFGHVAFVESVNNDGSITVSEMNYDGGPFAISTRTISANEASSYNYIHLN